MDTQYDPLALDAIATLSDLAQRLDQLGSRAYLDSFRRYRGRFLRASLAKLVDASGDAKAEGGDAPIAPEAYTPRTHPVIRFVEAFTMMVSSERQMVRDVLAPRNVDAVLPDIFEPALRLLVQEVGRVGKAKDAGHVYVLVDLFDVLEETKTSIFALFLPSAAGLFDDESTVSDSQSVGGSDAGLTADGPDSAVAANYEVQLRTVREVFDKVRALALRDVHGQLDELAKFQSRHASTVDGTVHESTSNVLHTLKRFFRFQSGLDKLLKREPPHKLPQDAAAAISMVRETPMTRYQLHMLMELIGAVEAAAKANRSSALGAIFEMNNLQHMRKALMSPAFMQVFGQSVVDHVNSRIRRTRDIYVERTWATCLESLFDIRRNKAGGKENGKAERNAVKQRFTTFNAEFERIYKEQQRYWIPDPDLRADVRRANVDLLLPLYRPFVEKYTLAAHSFTSNLSKYYKYDIATVESMMQLLFSENDVKSEA